MSELQVVSLGIDTIQPHPANPRIGDVKAIAESLQRFGQVRPIVVQKDTGYVIAGNHTREAAVTLGWENIEAVVMDVDDATAKAYLLADNKLAERGDYNVSKLADLMTEALTGVLNLDGTGYDIDDAETIQDAAGTTVVSDTAAPQSAVIKGAPPQPKTEQGQRDYEPAKDITLLLLVTRAAEFGTAMAAVQKKYMASDREPPIVSPGQKEGVWTMAATVFQLVQDNVS